MADLIALRALAADQSPVDAAQVGGKAAGLVRLLAAGLPAPDGLVVPADHPDLAAAAREACDRLPGDAYAVRSSGLDEDGADDSLAGANPTLLRVRPADLPAALETVRDAGGRGPIPVLLQVQLEPAAGGVAFSTDPLRGGPECVISSVAGHHADITDGIRAGAEQRVSPRGHVRGRGPLGRRQARAVAALTRRAAELLGTAADVEFAVTARGRVLLLQARPVTSFPVWEAPPGTWVLNAEHADAPTPPILLDLIGRCEQAGLRAGFAEMGSLLETLDLRRIGGYPFSRAVVAGAPAPGRGPERVPPAVVLGVLARLHPVQRARAARAQAFLRADGHRAASERSRAIDWEGLAAVAARAARDATGGGDVATSLATVLESLTTALEAHFRWLGPAYGQVVGAAGLALQRAGIPADRIPHIIGGPAAGAATDRMGAEVREAALAIGADPVARAHLARDDDSAAVLTALSSSPGRVGAAIRSLVDRMGVVSLGYDVGAPTVGERPVVVVDALRQEIAAQDAAPGASTSSPAAAAAALLAEVPDELHDLLRAAWAEHQERDRQGVTNHTALGAARVCLLAAGSMLVDEGLLDEAEDVLHLPLDEVQTWLAGGPGPRDARARAAAGARRLAHIGRLQPPAAIGGSPPPPPDLRHLPPAAREVNQRMLWVTAQLFGAVPAAGDGRVLAGLAAAPGAVEGTARILRSAQDATVLRPGEIIVCPFTMSVWTGLLQQCAGVVTEAGGPLSHAAIVARELGVPAVSGVTSATSRIPDGARITVDGGRGTVTVHDV